MNNLKKYNNFLNEGTPPIEKHREEGHKIARYIINLLN